MWGDHAEISAQFGTHELPSNAPTFLAWRDENDVLALGRDAPIRQDLIRKGHRRAQNFRWKFCVERVAAALNKFGNGRSSKS